MKNLYLDVHVLQTVPPSCINRDDTGSPKSAVYGGVQRARVSSQAWKHAMRVMFNNEFDKEDLGFRTKDLISLLVQELQACGFSEKADKVAKAAKTAFANAGIKLNKDDKTEALFFISNKQVKKLAELVISGEENKEAYKKALKDEPAIDIALFGRMVASDPSLNYDAAAQVAHSISTHEVRNEYDYFTAMDDCAPEDNAGAGHLGTVEYHSATLYRYATVNVRELAEKLDVDTAAVVKGFVKSFLLSMPTGKQNTFANRTVPDFAYITLRDDQPVNLAGAFEKPVQSYKEGYVDKSVEALQGHANVVYNNFLEKPQKAFCLGREVNELGEKKSLKELLNDLGEIINAYCEEK